MSPENFAKAKERVESNLLKYARFADFLHGTFPNQKFDQNYQELIALANKIRGCTGRCLTATDIQIIDNFLSHLINEPRFYPKLQPFSIIATEFAKAVYITHSVTLDTTWLQNFVPRLSAVEDSTKQIVSEVKTNPKTVSSIKTLMSTLVERKETFSYLIRKYLDETIKEVHLSGYDLDEICSVEHKVLTRRSRTGYVSDITAIRDCISHAHYKIEKKGDDYEIHFEWIEQGGYNYRRSFSRQEFFQFFIDAHSLEQLQAYIMTIILTGVLASIILKK